MPSSYKTMKGVAMVILSLSVSTKPHKRSELISALRQLCASTEREAGCQGCRIYQQIGDPDLINVEEIWVHRPDLDAHFCSGVFSALIGAVKLLGQYYEIRINDEIHTEGMDAVEGVWAKHGK